MHLIAAQSNIWEISAHTALHLNETEWKFGVSLARCAFGPRPPPVPNHGRKGAVVTAVVVINVTLSCKR